MSEGAGGDANADDRSSGGDAAAAADPDTDSVWMSRNWLGRQKSTGEMAPAAADSAAADASSSSSSGGGSWLSRRLGRQKSSGELAPAAVTAVTTFQRRHSTTALPVEPAFVHTEKRRSLVLDDGRLLGDTSEDADDVVSHRVVAPRVSKKKEREKRKKKREGERVTPK